MLVQRWEGAHVAGPEMGAHVADAGATWDASDDRSLGEKWAVFFSEAIAWKALWGRDSP